MEDTLAFSSSTAEAAIAPVQEPTPHLRNGRIQPYSTKYTPSRYGYVHRTTKSRFPPTSGAVVATGGKGEPAKSSPEEQSLSVRPLFYCRWGTTRFAVLVPSWELDVGHWAWRLDGMGCEREEWAEGRSGQSDTFPFSFAGYSLQQRKTTLLCYLLTRVNCRNGRHFCSFVRTLQLCKMGVPGGRPN